MEEVDVDVKKVVVQLANATLEDVKSSLANLVDAMQNVA